MSCFLETVYTTQSLLPAAGQPLSQGQLPSDLAQHPSRILAQPEQDAYYVEWNECSQVHCYSLLNHKWKQNGKRERKPEKRDEL